MKTRLRTCLALAMLGALFGVPAVAAAVSFPPATSFPSIGVQMRPLKPGMPPRPLLPGKTSSSAPTTVRYSQSAWAGNMVLPAIWLGLPTIVIIALIIRSMKGD
jgi:hypothetical protein